MTIFSTLTITWPKSHFYISIKKNCWTVEISCVYGIRRIFWKIPWMNVRRRHEKHLSIWVLWKCFGFLHDVWRWCVYVFRCLYLQQKQLNALNSTDSHSTKPVNCTKLYNTLGCSLVDRVETVWLWHTLGYKTLTKHQHTNTMNSTNFTSIHLAHTKRCTKLLEIFAWHYVCLSIPPSELKTNIIFMLKSISNTSF